MESYIVGWVLWEVKLGEEYMSKAWVGVGTGCSIGYRKLWDAEMVERWGFGIGKVV
jgi:hypothetical protein